VITLIQIGGLGVITTSALFALLAGRKIGLEQRTVMQDAISAPGVGGIVRLTRFILMITFAIEGIGAILMFPVFSRDYGIRSGIWMSIFHSISAFCNAGFDIMGTHTGKFSSMTSYISNPVITLTISGLIVCGGIGFLTWDDIKKHKFHLKHYKMQSKAILSTTFVLILVPTLFFYFYEFKNMSGGTRILASIFQAVTPRTAGFNTVDYGKMSSSGKAISTLLMLIGGAPGSTAGGMKVTTVAVILVAARSVYQRKNYVGFFKREISDDVVRNAISVLFMYATLFFVSGIAVSMIENIPVGDCFFEVASALGTVGLTTGITPHLSYASRAILMILMFIGRVGGLTLIFGTLHRKACTFERRPHEGITVG
jgi:trk system potassium uptake protein TrkH